MKITVFPESENKHADRCFRGTLKTIDSKEMLERLVTGYSWSPLVFENDYRAGKNFISTDFMVLDVDNGLTLEEAISLGKALGYNFLIGPTRSHQKDKNGVKCDRFRVILPLSYTMRNVEDYRATWDYIAHQFHCDIQCKDFARFYFACTSLEFFRGFRFLEPVRGMEFRKRVDKHVDNPHKKGRLSNRTRYF